MRVLFDYSSTPLVCSLISQLLVTLQLSSCLLCCVLVIWCVVQMHECCVCRLRLAKVLVRIVSLHYALFSWNNWAISKIVNYLQCFSYNLKIRNDLSDYLWTYICVDDVVSFLNWFLFLIPDCVMTLVFNKIIREIIGSLNNSKLILIFVWKLRPVIKRWDRFVVKLAFCIK